VNEKSCHYKKTHVILNENSATFRIQGEQKTVWSENTISESAKKSGFERNLAQSRFFIKIKKLQDQF